MDLIPKFLQTTKEQDRSDAWRSWEATLHYASIYCICLIWEAGPDKLINVSLLSPQCFCHSSPLHSLEQCLPLLPAAAPLTAFTEFRDTWLFSSSHRTRNLGAVLNSVNPASRGLWWWDTGAGAEHWLPGTGRLYLLENVYLLCLYMPVPLMNRGLPFTSVIDLFKVFKTPSNLVGNEELLFPGVYTKWMSESFGVELQRVCI